jgi:CRP/FNR family transcriptional regulator
MLRQSEVEALVALYPVLSRLTAAEQDALRREVQSAHIPAGTVLFDLDSPCSLFLLLTAGTVRVVKPALSGREIVLYRLDPGDSCILTVSCLLGESSYPARGVAETDVAAYILPRPLFYRLLGDSEPFRAFVFRYFAARISELMQLVEEVVFGALDQRLAAYLAGDAAPRLEMTHQQIADELGTVREVDQPAAQGARTGRGWCGCERGQVEVLDLKRLGRVAAPAG